MRETKVTDKSEQTCPMRCNPSHLQKRAGQTLAAKISLTPLGVKKKKTFQDYRLDSDNYLTNIMTTISPRE